MQQENLTTMPLTVPVWNLGIPMRTLYSDVHPS